MKRFLAIIVLPLFLSACLDSPGTNTGNPGMNHSEPGSGMPGGDDGSPSNSVYILAYFICGKIKSCYPQSNWSECQKKVMSINGYNSELGSTAVTYNTMEDLAIAVNNNNVMTNTTNFENCVDNFKDLNCSDTLVQSAYSDSIPSDYSQTNLLFRASTACQQIY